MDNQQVRRLMRFAWLGGIVDGEGHFGFYETHVAGKNRTQYQIKPCSSITNCDGRIIDPCKEILDEMRVGYRVRTREPYQQKSGVMTSPTSLIRIEGFQRLQTYIPQILPFLASKHQEAELVWAFIESRLSAYPNTPYTPYELSLVQASREAKKSRNLTDYTPNGAWLRPEDIVGTTDESGRITTIRRAA